MKLFGLTIRGRRSEDALQQAHKRSLEKVVELGLRVGDLEDQLEGAARERIRLTNDVLKAQGIYAGPLHGYTPADGTGLKLDGQIVGYRVERRQDVMNGRLPGQIELTASVTLLNADVHALQEARHVEWEGIKWKAGSAQLSRGFDIERLGGPSIGYSNAEVSLEAFVEYVPPGKVLGS